MKVLFNKQEYTNDESLNFDKLMSKTFLQWNSAGCEFCRKANSIFINHSYVTAQSVQWIDAAFAATPGKMQTQPTIYIILYSFLLCIKVISLCSMQSGH